MFEYRRAPQKIILNTEQMSLHTTTPGAPKMKYKREGTIEDNDRSCILKSAASALSFLWIRPFGI
jgi:hypothetical protein